MKKILIVFVFLFPAFCVAQDTLKYPHIPIEAGTGNYIFTDIVSIPSLSKDDMYAKANEWVAMHFVSAKNVIQMNDKAAGKMVVKALIDTSVMYKMWFYITIPYHLYFTLNLTAKNGKCRLLISNLYVVKYNSPLLSDERKKIYLNSEIEKDIYKYNHSKKHHNPNDDTDGYMTPKRTARLNQAYLLQIQSFADNTFNSFKNAMLKQTDNF